MIDECKQPNLTLEVIHQQVSLLIDHNYQHLY